MSIPSDIQKQESFSLQGEVVQSNNYFNIIRYNNLDEVFFKYYVCNNNKYLNNDFKYDKIKNIKQCYNILPKNYLKLFVYPLLYN